MFGINGPHLTRLTQDSRPLGCLHCGSDENVAIESIESLPPHPGELQVQVGYVCRKCQGNYRHRARFRDVAAVLNRNQTLEGLLRFAGEYFHCGEAMRIVGSNTKNIYAPLSTDDLPAEAPPETPAVSVGTSVLRCRCGFQLEVPD
ncbi:hypothetical protein [Paenarthrobacter sp. NPDC018779]|uniref:hypothetical protein n=1 Tax=Paenarthrobacter sp. NPDC018779 TaxID=3364375 RepID=UPI0037C60EFF